MTVLSTQLGNPMSYADQRGGAIFHDIFPTVANAAKVSSQIFLVGLGFHSEMFFHPTPPAFLILHCLRPDPAEAALRPAVTTGCATTSLDALGKMSFRRAGHIHHLGVGYASARTRVLAIADDTTATVIDLKTGEILSTHHIDPAKNYWRNTQRAPGRWPGAR